jgi:ABC-2 type transport system permease protein
VDEMIEALEGARRWYGEWFAPFPWKELRLTEFAAMATYAQGSPGNITFSEGIGFLTKSEPKANAAFWITAHEAAHQWWPNMAMSGEGPGGDVLSEGMSHFSTILLVEQVKGIEQRMAFCRQIEDGYGNIRRRDAERPMVKVNGELPGDRRIIYDKGGWVFWMLFQHMGRDAGLAALKDYMATYRDSRDHPVLPDYLAIMRRHAADTTAFDAFVKQWFYEVVVPQYQVRDAQTVKTASGWEVRATIKNTGTADMPVEVAAVRGERFAKDASGDKAYRDARVTMTLGKDASLPVVIPCDFEPQKVVVDPDVRVLQLNRKKAAVDLKASRASDTKTAMR